MWFTQLLFISSNFLWKHNHHCHRNRHTPIVLLKKLTTIEKTKLLHNNRMRLNAQNPLNDIDNHQDEEKDIARNKNIKHNDHNDESKEVPNYVPFLSHSRTICMVPPSNDEKVWSAVQQIRRDLRDPGLYRWPPHANILYPFIDFKKQKNERVKSSNYTSGDSTFITTGEKSDLQSKYFKDPSILFMLQEVCEKNDPFEVKLNSLGCFGGKRRGVLWIYPKSRSIISTSSSTPSTTIDDDETTEPLIDVQQDLESAFPITKKKYNMTFTPHMTLTHFASLESANEAKANITLPSGKDELSFVVNELYVLERKGDDGQFKIIVTIDLLNSEIKEHDPPKIFPFMPTEEEEWVRAERMKLKKRRNNNSRRRRRNSKSKKKQSSPSPLPPPQSIDITDEMDISKVKVKKSGDEITPSDIPSPSPAKISKRRRVWNYTLGILKRLFSRKNKKKE